MPGAKGMADGKRNSQGQYRGTEKRDVWLQTLNALKSQWICFHKTMQLRQCWKAEHDLQKHEFMLMGFIISVVKT